jgi:hypothetical protein
VLIFRLLPAYFLITTGRNYKDKYLHIRLLRLWGGVPKYTLEAKRWPFVTTGTYEIPHPSRRRFGFAARTAGTAE